MHSSLYTNDVFWCTPNHFDHCYLPFLWPSGHAHKGAYMNQAGFLHLGYLPAVARLVSRPLRKSLNLHCFISSLVVMSSCASSLQVWCGRWMCAAWTFGPWMNTFKTPKPQNIHYPFVHGRVNNPHHLSLTNTSSHTLVLTLVFYSRTHQRPAGAMQCGWETCTHSK